MIDTKVVLPHGQNHRRSSWHAAYLLLEQLSMGALHESYLPKDMPHFRCGCYHCTESGEDFCLYTAYMASIMKAMKGADLLIFATPTYCLRTSGSIKAFLDHRLLNLVVYRPLPFMYHKRVIILASGAGSGMKKAAKDIHANLTGRGISHISSYGFRSMAATQEAAPENTKRGLTTDLAGLASRIKRKQHRKRISWGQKLLFHAMRQTQRHGMGAGELDYQYWKERDWLGRSRLWTDDEQNTCIYFRCITCIYLLSYAV